MSDCVAIVEDDPEKHLKSTFIVKDWFEGLPVLLHKLEELVGLHVAQERLVHRYPITAPRLFLSLGPEPLQLVCVVISFPLWQDILYGETHRGLDGSQL